jgi:molecular chaperone HscB
MICWSCEKNAGDGLLCVACAAVQPPDAQADHFSVLGVARRFDLDLADLERRYKDLTKILHPDRFARADARARRASLSRSVQLNDAWRTLRDPVRRAEYLLRLAGIDLSESNQRIPVAPALLMETMELREGLAEARAARDGSRVRALAMDVRGRRTRALAEVAVGFAADQPDLEAIGRTLIPVRYYDRFLEEVAVAEETEQAMLDTAGHPYG